MRLTVLWVLIFGSGACIDNNGVKYKLLF